MENEMMNYVVKFNAHGFVPGKDVSEENWERAKAEFIAMQNVFATMTNQILDKVNDTWSKYEKMKEIGDCISIYLLQQTMEIEEKTTYGDWI